MASRSLLSLMLWQSRHLQVLELQYCVALKHSQYFLRHWLFLQLQPLLSVGTVREVTPSNDPATAAAAAIPVVFLGRNALGLRSSADTTILDLSRIFSTLFSLLWHLTQLHISVH